MTAHSNKLKAKHPLKERKEKLPEGQNLSLNQYLVYKMHKTNQIPKNWLCKAQINPQKGIYVYEISFVTNYLIPP